MDIVVKCTLGIESSKTMHLNFSSRGRVFFNLLDYKGGPNCLHVKFFLQFLLFFRCAPIYSLNHFLLDCPPPPAALFILCSFVLQLIKECWAKDCLCISNIAILVIIILTFSLLEMYFQFCLHFCESHILCTCNFTDSCDCTEFVGFFHCLWVGGGGGDGGGGGGGGGGLYHNCCRLIAIIKTWWTDIYRHI